MDVRIQRNVDVPMRDGVRLRADVWREDDTPRPAIVIRTPYNKETLGMDMLRPNQAVAAGYVWVVQDTRGRFASEGDWQPLMWDQEGPDTYDTVEWVAAQPWCDGNVGMAGPSYLSIVQMLGAMEQPPHLKAIAPTMTTDAGYELQETGGAFRLDHVLSWFAFMAGDWLQRRIAAGSPPAPEDIGKIAAMCMDPRVVMDHLPVRENPWFQIPDFPLDLTQLLSGEIGHTVRYRYEDIKVPVLLVAGFWDVFARATTRMLGRLREESPADPAEHRLIIGPWAHAGVLPGYQGEMNFGIMAAGVYAKVPEQHLAFFDRHLKGTGDALPPVTYFLANAGEWRTATAWPPAEAGTTEFYLRAGDTGQGGGRLSPHPPGEEPPDRYLSDPHDPVPTHGGRVLYLGGLVMGPFDQSHLESREDVLVYTSEPLDKPLDVVGEVRLRLFAASSAVDTDFAAKLLDVGPDGRAILVCDGNRRARHRNGYDREEPLEPGAVEEYEIDLGPAAWRFQPGHALRVHVQSSNFPHLDRNMQTGNALGVDAKGEVATQTVHHEGAWASRLELPVLR